MTEVASVPVARDMGLMSRIINVFVAPRTAYEAVAARPRVLGVMAVVLTVMISAQFIFLSTEVGQNAALDQQIGAMKAFGVNVTDEMVQQMETRMAYAPYTGSASLLVFVPLIAAAMAGLLLAIFTVVTGGGASYKQMFAVVAHSQLIGALQQVFTLPIAYAREEIVSPTRLAVFFPMLDDMGFAYYLLSAIDLFYIWSTINVAIGVAVLYKRRTGPIAAVLLGIYAVIAVIIAAVRAF
jgi:hypothetical protein